MLVEVRAGICTACRDIIYSRALHDQMYCSCRSCFIDGGSLIIGDTTSFGYIRTMGELVPTTVKLLEFDSIQEAKKALYEDWSTGQDRYGRISK